MNIEGVPEILEAVLREDNDDLKDVFHPDEDYPGDWVQIGGDFGDPWIYGGDWLNAHKKELLHFDGIEHDKEIDYRKIEVPPHVMAKIVARVHDPELDTLEDDDHKKWLLSREEWEIERIADNYRVARADLLEARKKRQFWQVDLDQKWLIKAVDKQGPELAKQFEAGVWEELPFEQRLIEFGRYYGWQDIADDFLMDHIEAQNFLRTRKKDLTTD
jgi:hypothetical protein